MQCTEQCCLENLFLMWSMGSWRQLYNFENGTHDLLHCDFTWPPFLVLYLEHEKVGQTSMVLNILWP